MILTIDTSLNDEIKVSLIDKKKVIADKRMEAKYAQAEKLVPLIDQMLNESKVILSDLKEIHVQNKGNSFTALRIGIVTANALGYALGINVKEISEKKNFKTDPNFKFNIVKPKYNREASVG